MNEKNYDKYIREGDKKETAICKAILDDYGLSYRDDLDCDECPGQNECIPLFINRC